MAWRSRDLMCQSRPVDFCFARWDGLKLLAGGGVSGSWMQWAQSYDCGTVARSRLVLFTLVTLDVSRWSSRSDQRGQVSFTNALAYARATDTWWRLGPILSMNSSTRG